MIVPEGVRGPAEPRAERVWEEARRLALRLSRRRDLPDHVRQAVQDFARSARVAGSGDGRARAVLRLAGEARLGRPEDTGADRIVNPPGAEGTAWCLLAAMSAGDRPQHVALSARAARGLQALAQSAE